MKSLTYTIQHSTCQDFHARQLDSKLGCFTSIDPMAEKYYGISPYAYCAGDPVNCIDPSGCDWYRNDSTGNYTWFNDEGEKNPSHEGYSYVGKKGSVCGELEGHVDEILRKNFFKLDGLYADGLVLRLWGQTNYPDGSLGLVMRMFKEFQHGFGPEVTLMSEQNVLTQELMNDPLTSKKLSSIKCGQMDGVDWGLLDLFTTPSSLKQFLGSYHMRKWCSQGKSMNIVFDSKSEYSWLYHANDLFPLKYIQSIQNHSRSVRREYGTTYQFYYWSK